MLYQAMHINMKMIGQLCFAHAITLFLFNMCPFIKGVDHGPSKKKTFWPRQWAKHETHWYLCYPTPYMVLALRLRLIIKQWLIFLYNYIKEIIFIHYMLGLVVKISVSWATFTDRFVTPYLERCCGWAARPPLVLVLIIQPLSEQLIMPCKRVKNVL